MIVQKHIDFMTNIDFMPQSPNLSDSVSTDSVLNNLNTTYTLTTEEEDERQSFIDYVSVKKQMIADSLNYPDSTSLLALDNLYNNGTGMAVLLAVNHLVYANWIEIELPHYGIDNDTLKSANYGVRPSFDGKEMTKEAWLRVKPNPASNYFIVDYSLPENVKEAVIVVYSIDGDNRKEIHVSRSMDEFVISTSGMKSGIYIVSLKVNSSVLQSVKLSIVK